ncbi:MAG: hypothetical protein Q9226_007027, partial [Calogaya cf. arnoldii]
WVRSLGAAFRDRNVPVLDDKFLPITDDIAQPWSLMHLMASVELINAIDQPRGNAKAREWWKMYDRAAEEVRLGATIRMAMVQAIAKSDTDDGSSQDVVEKNTAKRGTE